MSVPTCPWSSRTGRQGPLASSWRWPRTSTSITSASRTASRRSTTTSSSRQAIVDPRTAARSWPGVTATTTGGAASGIQGDCTGTVPPLATPCNAEGGSPVPGAAGHHARTRAYGWTMTYEHVLVDRDGPFTTITMNRPDRRNALSTAHMEELTDAFRVAGASDARGIVLAGNGPVFSA